MTRLAAALAIALTAACGDTGSPPDEPAPVDPKPSSTSGCVDKDGDGFGRRCEEGPDCDDSDDTVFEGCPLCYGEKEGCACESDAAPVECALPESEYFRKNGILCKTGERYCRDETWTACIGVASFAE